MELLTKAVPIAMLAFVVSSMLAVGLSLTIGQIVAPLRNGKLVFFALLANFVLMPATALGIARLLRLDQPLGVALLLLGAAAGAPFLPKLAGIAKGNLAFAVGLMVLLMVLTVAYMPLVLPLLLEGVSVDPMKIARSLVSHDASTGCRTCSERVVQKHRRKNARAAWPDLYSKPCSPDCADAGDELSESRLLIWNTRHSGEHSISICRCWDWMAAGRSGLGNKGSVGARHCTTQYCRCARRWW